MKNWEEASPFQFSLKVHDIVGEVLAQRFRDFFKNEADVPNADWSLDITPIAKKVLGDDEVFKAIIYGKYVKAFTYSGNPNKGCYASLLPGQYCPAHPDDEIDEEVLIGMLQNKVFPVKIEAFGRWWWAGAPATLMIIRPQPFQIESWQATPQVKGTISAGQTIPIKVQIKFRWGTGQRSVAFRLQFDLLNASGQIVDTQESKIFVVTRDGDLPAETTITLTAHYTLPETLPPGSYTINATLYYFVP